jgi:hypothetical protein
MVMRTALPRNAMIRNDAGSKFSAKHRSMDYVICCVAE